jgi:hypothetical protein
MAIRPTGRQRSLSKKVSSFNMYMDQVYQVRAIMEATGAVKDAPLIRELLDEALAARRRKAAGVTDSEEPPGQEISETLHTLQTLLLKLIRREELLFKRQNVGLRLLRKLLSKRVQVERLCLKNLSKSLGWRRAKARRR